MRYGLLLLLILSISGCADREDPVLTSFTAYCEQVANGAKPIALSAPMEQKELNQYWEQFEEIAMNFDVEVYRDRNFPVTSLFPASVTNGMEVPVIYREPRLTQYQQLKEDLDNQDPELAARRMGRLLGYSPSGINGLLMKNSDFRTLSYFGVNSQITHLYYEDLEEAILFYKEVLGLKSSGESTFAIGDDALIQLHSFVEDHPKGQQKSTAIALLTDQLPAWYAYVQERGVPIKYTYKPREGGPHDGFVAIDPGGYLLEFEQFKQHPENELFVAVLRNTPRVRTGIDDLEFYGSITWTYHNDLLQMQQFYEEKLGYVLVADQGWTKIYQTSPSGFIGLVDERRGMMDYAENKAIEIEWQLNDRKTAEDYFSRQEEWSAPGKWIEGPESYRYLIR